MRIQIYSIEKTVITVQERKEAKKTYSESLFKQIKMTLLLVKKIKQDRQTNQPRISRYVQPTDTSMRFKMPFFNCILKTGKDNNGFSLIFNGPLNVIKIDVSVYNNKM